jgi:hypothetical protein
MVNLGKEIRLHHEYYYRTYYEIGRDLPRMILPTISRIRSILEQTYIRSHNDWD